MRIFTLFTVACSFLVLFASTASAAGEPKRIGAYGDWSVYVLSEGGGKVCYMVSEPKKSEGKYKTRSKAYALLTNRPSDGTKNVFSFIAGYDYPDDSRIELSVDGNKFTLYTQKDTAWAQDDAADNSIAQAIRSGSSMVVKGTSSRGTQTVDTFSLRGSGAAQDAVTKECGS